MPEITTTPAPGDFKARRHAAIHDRDDSPAGDLRYDQALAEISADERLVSACQSAIKTLQSAILDVEAGLSVNGLGVLQGRALDVDLAAALRQQVYEQGTAIRWHLDKIAGSSTTTAVSPSARSQAFRSICGGLR